MTKKRLALWPLGILLILVGVLLTAGGGWLAALGGSLYYLPTGLACLLSGVFICRGNRLGLWLYLIVLTATLVWALAEVGLQFWLLLPRLGGPVVLGLYMLTPWVRHAFGPERASREPPATRSRSRAPVAVAVALLIVGIAALTLHWQGGTAQSAGPLTPQAATNWSDYAGSKAGQRFSPASQITPANVSGLKVAWTYRTGDLPKDPRQPQMFEATPLQIGDTLYLCTGHNIVIALDADTGKERWRHDPKTAANGVYTLACRGVAYHQAPDPAIKACHSRILVGTIDGRMLALDAQTGQRCQDFGRNGEISLHVGLGAVKPGVQFVTSPPMIVGNAAVVGGFVLDNMGTQNPSGVVRAFDVLSGKELWSWDAGRHDPNAVLKPSETYVHGSPNAWSLFSADEKLGLVYIPTGNPSPDHFGGQRSADMDRYGSSVVALDAATGQTRWSFQTVHHDLWDYDVASQPVLVDMPINGQTVPALIQGTKQGEIFLLDRRTGRPLAPVQERPVPQGDMPGERYSPTQPVSLAFPSLVPPPLREADMWGATPVDQLWCRIAFRKLRYSGRFTPPSLDNSLIFPGNNGIMNWGSIAVDAERQVMIVPTSYMPLTLKLIPRKEAPATDEIVLDGRGAISPMRGTPYAVRTERPFVSPLGLPCNAPPWGRLTAIDLKTRQILWQRPLGTTADHAPLRIPVPGVFNQGGAMVTRGGLAFIGAAMDNYLRAFDLKSGKELWKGRLPAGGQALPMSYVSPRTGKQYVVIAAGGHAFMHTTIGDYVVAYSLDR
ncbi:membrane-bound PQQ-dependent dehydrogenase, glucose/quinate/shikimate family [Sphingobium estronivorans]|uniref:membrane-bound PQQ-dependent dehydrogenase, glucose/quinate/shikimate family n=1 Tax=Sphingobium estronivorans TaxID=1577690 RepID=UPI001238509F|nr:membrane-bound PQQ-dependent dehydrogenase, glucose/quinate/shikimate family [Sphingobium estronivorans]